MLGMKQGYLPHARQSHHTQYYLSSPSSGSHNCPLFSASVYFLQEISHWCCFADSGLFEQSPFQGVRDTRRRNQGDRARCWHGLCRIHVGQKENIIEIIVRSCEWRGSRASWTGPCQQAAFWGPEAPVTCMLCHARLRSCQQAGNEVLIMHFRGHI